MVKVTLKDGSIREYEKGTTILQVAEGISQSLAKATVGGEINGELVDIRTPLVEDCSLNLVTDKDPKALVVLRHTSAHILAQAVKRLYPEAKLTIGPSIENGFYYDFDVEPKLADSDLEKITKEVNKIIKEGLAIERFTLPRSEAIDLLKEMKEEYKVELVADIPEGEEISFYKQGEFTDLCAGPHLFNTKQVKAITLLNVSGSYWRGNAENKMLSRVYGTAFFKKADLEQHLHMLEEAKKRDHRKLGRELELFALLEEGPGFPFFLPKGMLLRNTLIDFWRAEHKKAGYDEIYTPIILNQELWHRSGHWDHYKENMYSTVIDESDFAVKPMNCPGGMLVYKTKMHSYRELPIRMAELGLVHRHELSGALHGLMRVRNFTQDDAHIFMLPEQIKDEVVGVMNLVDKLYSVFGFEYHVELSTRPEKSMGTKEEWDRAEDALREALEQVGKNYVLNEGDGAFYGPKIDFHIRDCLGRTWQCGTIQLDFQMPQRFDLNYVGADGEKHRPVMLHRALFGSIERFIGILIEHYAGKFPAWLAPTQVKILPITEKFNDYAKQVFNELQEAGLRVELDDRNEKIGYKIREAQLEQVPYMLVVGEKEMNENAVAVRSRKQGDQGAMALQEFISLATKEIAEKAYNA